MTPDAVIQAVLACRAGHVVAPAGCGKTECIADAVKASEPRCLILTHTLAGVDALRLRLHEKGVDTKHFDLDTIAAWSFRFARAFPQRSGLTDFHPKGGAWSDVYKAATTLVARGSITSILKASYRRILVDEYQDCTLAQHELVVALSQHMPVCAFGDPLQGIFGFRGEPVVDWIKDVSAAFPQCASLLEPHRWYRIGNNVLGDWLMGARRQLEDSGEIALAGAPNSVVVIQPREPTAIEIAKAQLRACNNLSLKATENLIVISAKASESVRAKLASKTRCTTIEAVSCQRLSEFVSGLSSHRAEARLTATLTFACDVMTGIPQKALLRRICKLSTGWRGTALLKAVEVAGMDVLASDELEPVLRLLCELKAIAKRTHRRELYFAAINTLKGSVAGEHSDLEAAAWHVQNKSRHLGRRLSRRSVGSTLLVKGLQFDHAVIVTPEQLSRNDLYVALTRAARTLTIVSSTMVLRPKASRARTTKQASKPTDQFRLPGL